MEWEMYDIANDYVYLHSWSAWFCERICTMVYMYNPIMANNVSAPHRDRFD
jgi:hypothetical protein